MHCRNTRLFGLKPVHVLHRQTRTVTCPSQKEPDVTKEVANITRQLVQAVVKSQVLPTAGWRHRRSLRGEEKILEKDVRAAARRPQTKQQTAWQEADTELDEIAQSTEGEIPIPGTYVDIRRGSASSSGIIVGHALVDNRNFMLTLTLAGDVLTHYVADIYFEIPQTVPRDLAERAGISLVPTKKTEISARVEILRRLRDVERRIVQAYNAIGSRSISLYPLVVSKNPDEWSTITVSQAVNLISDPKRTNSYNLVATHRYLMNHPLEFEPHTSSHRTIQTWRVRPQSHVDKLMLVRDLVHQSSPAIDSFVSKARAIMAANRKRSAESWNEPPTQELDMDVRYTRVDRMIIDVLHHSLHRSRQIRADPYSLVVTTVLKKLEVTEVVSTNSLYQVLVDLGHLAPWDDMVSRRSELGLDHVPEDKAAKTIIADQIVERNLARLTTDNLRHDTPLGPEDLYPRDPVEHLRHDFGNLPVYVVDDVDAEELDDGLSIEPVLSEPGAAWIHVHVADPTAIIPPTHIFAQEARKIGFTVYLPHRTWPMLPKSLTLSRMSLGANSPSGEPERVLTFSFKLDATGSMVDYNVRAALVRNIVTVDYDSVDRLLGTAGSRGPFRPFDLLGRSPTPPVPSLSANHIDNLRLINETVSKHGRHNQASSNYFYTSLAKAKITVSPKPLLGTPLDCPDPHRFRGFPSMTYEIVEQQMQNSGARMIVSECMKAACRVASRWSFEHRVPMLRRSSKPPVCLGDPRAIQKLLAMRKADGHVDFYAVKKSQLFIPPVEHTLEPAIHWSMGIPDREGYIRVTSPLRRYNDLVAHWQIKHALLNPGTNAWLFSPEWLNVYAPEIKQKEKALKRTERLDTDFWSHLYIKRFMEDPRPAVDRCDPLQFLNATISGARLDDNGAPIAYVCHLPSLGLLGLLPTPSGGEFVIGDDVKVSVRAVELVPQPHLQLSLRET